MFKELVLRPKLVTAVRYLTGLSEPLFGESFHHVDCSIETKQGSSRGFGISRNKKIAEKKAFFEAIERCALHRSDSPVMGSAAHLSFESAKTGAIKEMVERDCYIRWSLGLTKGELVDRSRELFVIALRTGDDSTSVCLAFSLSFECIPFGLGAGENIHSAREKSLEELAQSLIRHRATNCLEDVTQYGIQHSYSRRPYWRKRFEKFDSGKECEITWDQSASVVFEMQGCHRWPCYVVGARNSSLLSWDFDMMSNPSAFGRLSSESEPIPLG